MRSFHTLLLTFILSLLVGCSLIQTTYNNAPALAIFWLDDYFRFTPAQQNILKPSLQKLLQWHRKTQLPNYIELLTRMQTSLSQPQLQAGEICGYVDDIKSKLHTLQLESAPVVVEVAPLLSDTQLQRFQKKVDERAQKWKETWWAGTPAEQLEARNEKLQEYAQTLYGDLTTAQINQLKQSITQQDYKPAITYKEILRRNEDAYEILNTLRNSSLSNDEKLQITKAGYARLQHSPDTNYENYTNALKQQTCATFASLHNGTNNAQKLHAKNWLQGYIKQLQTLQQK